MDKLMDSSLFMKLVSLSLAILLFITVNFQTDNKKGKESATSKLTTEVIEDVPVSLIYDEENLVVSGVPQFVEVKIEGPNAIVQTTKTLRNFEVYVDLTDAQIGEKRVPIEIREISDKLDVKIEPSFAQVSIQERVSKEVIVEPEYNEAMIAEGYYAELTTVEPNKVTVTGAKDVIDKITYVKATLNNNGTIDSTITREAIVLVLDEKLNKLPVVVEPETVQLTIPVKSLDKVVPINVVQKGKLPAGLTLNSIDLSVKEATITASRDNLNKIDNVTVEVDLSKVNDNMKLNLPITFNESIIKIDPRTVDLKISVTKEEEVTISKVPLKTIGLAENLIASFIDLTNGQTSLLVSGPSNIVNKLKASDFELTVNTSNLGEGKHDLEIDVVGPANVKWELLKKTVKVQITESD